MLPKKYRLKNKRDFDKVHRGGKFYQNKYTALKLIKNNLPESRIGIIVSTKVSKKAVVRNKVKRIIRASILGFLTKVAAGYDVVIMVRPEIARYDFAAIDAVIKELFYKAKLITDQND